MRAKVAAASRPAITTQTSATNPSLNTKAGKRAQKHDALISRIEKAQKKPLKRRRPNKKLNTALEGLADALPDLEDNDDDEWEGIDDDEDMGESGGMLGELSKMVRVRKPQQQQKMKLKTLKTRPGAMKRKQKLEDQEKERFGKNLASMNVQAPVAANAASAQAEAGATGNRWAALRGFIGQTMEQNAAFRKA